MIHKTRFKFKPEKVMENVQDKVERWKWSYIPGWRNDEEVIEQAVIVKRELQDRLEHSRSYKTNKSSDRKVTGQSKWGSAGQAETMKELKDKMEQWMRN